MMNFGEKKERELLGLKPYKKIKDIKYSKKEVRDQIGFKMEL